MACLVCGKSIGMVRRFKDPQFCSDEHRQSWQMGREQVLVERLVEARIRIERARDRYLAEQKSEQPGPEPEPAGFARQGPAEQCGFPIPAVVGPEAGGISVVRKPRVLLSQRPRNVLAGFQADLPWPAWNAGLHTFGPLGLDGLAWSPALDFSRAAAHVFGTWKPRRAEPRLPEGHLAYTRRPDVMGRRPVVAALPLQWVASRPVFSSLLGRSEDRSV